MSTKCKVSGEALFGKIRRELLCLFFLNPDRSFYLLELVEILQTGRGGVQRELANLVESGIISRIKKGVKVFFKISDECGILGEMQDLLLRLMNIEKMISSVLKLYGGSVTTAVLSSTEVNENERSANLMLACEGISEELISELEKIQLLSGIRITLEIVRSYELGAFIRDHPEIKWLSPGEGILLVGKPENLIPEESEEIPVIEEPDLFSGSGFTW